MRERITQWIGQEVSVSFTSPAEAEGYAGSFDIQRGKLMAADGLGLEIETTSGYDTWSGGNEYGEGRKRAWVTTTETACIPWSAVAKVSKMASSNPVVDEGD